MRRIPFAALERYGAACVAGAGRLFLLLRRASIPPAPFPVLPVAAKGGSRHDRIARLTDAARKAAKDVATTVRHEVRIGRERVVHRR